MQGLSMEVDLYVLPMKGPDVVLMIQWLQKLGKVTHDYSQQNMEFTLDNKTYLLQWDESLRMKLISLHRMQALLETNDVYGGEMQKLVNEMLGQAATLEYLRHIISRYGVAMDPKKIAVIMEWFKWGELEAKAFEGLKQQLTNTTIMGLPNFNEILLWSSMLRRRELAVKKYQIYLRSYKGALPVEYTSFDL
ncbi:hypothetical protein Tco_0918898 [Tanacetum coccineum]